MAGPKTASLEPKIIDRLLDLLGDSDKFRELFQQSPATALELIGHVEPDAAERPATDSVTAESTGAVSIASCLNVTQLASKEVIRSARSELRTMFLRGLGQISPLLEATKSG
jgi:putative modified peptide